MRVHPIFDSYDVAISIREATQEKRVRRGKQVSTPSTIGSQIPLLVQRFRKRSLTLSHIKTTKELTINLTDKALKHFRRQSGKLFVVTLGSKCEATYKDVCSYRATKEKLCWKAFSDVRGERNQMRLVTTLTPSDEAMKAIENFKLICMRTICSMPNMSITREKDLQWYLFCKKQAQSERLPLNSSQNSFICPPTSYDVEQRCCRKPQ